MAAAAVLCVASLPASAGTAAALNGPAGFGMAPVPSGTSPQLPYFLLTAEPGHATTAKVIFENTSGHTTKLRVLRSYGVTSPNSGGAYDTTSTGCQGTACWIEGLPATVTLKPHEEREQPFTVRVPAGTPDQQYLAGISAQLAIPPRSVAVGRNGRASARAIIINRVTIGVAVTVGQLSTLRTRLTIPTVTGGREMTIPRLFLQLANPGQTFAKASGRVSCRVGTKTDRFSLATDTVLPGQQATMPINAQPLGFNKTVPCTARMSYGHNQVATWSGLVKMPSTAQPTKTYHTGNGVYTSLPARNNSIPDWAIALIVVGSLCLLGMGGMAFWILRRGALRRA